MLLASAIRRASLAGLLSLAASVFAQPIPPSTAIPVRFPHTVMAGRSRPGDAVAAMTTQAIDLPGGLVLPAGSLLTGHVVASTAFAFNSAPYAAQQPSVLSIHFDSLEAAGRELPVRLSLRAVAGPVSSENAATPHGLDEIDWSPTQTLIGGDTTSNLQGTVLSPDGSMVGYRRKDGLFARLIAASAGAVPCDASATEQSVGDFSPDACGVYGVGGVSLAAGGSQGEGTFVLQSRLRSVALPAGSTALLEEIP